jgi:glycosyltransferase involved in cell wall biosynthesis
MNQYRIAMVAACPFPCERGTPVRIHRMAEALLARGHEVHVVTYHLGESIDLHPDLHVHRIPRLATYRKMSPGPSPQKLLVTDVLLTRRLRQVLHEHSFDIIHAHHIEGLTCALSARRQHRHIPVVFDAHTLLYSELPYYTYRPLRSAASLIGGWIDKRFAPRADYIIAVTDSIREHLLREGHTTPETSATVGNGTEFERFDTIEPRQRSDDDECIFVFTGNLAAYQGIEPMLQAFASLHSRRSNVRLRIVTRASFDAYEKLARKLKIDDKLELLKRGFDDVPRLLGASDIAINPRIEAPGLPQKTMNYMAAGMPLVSFAGSGKYLVDGETALLVPDGDTEAFSAAMERLMDDPVLARRLGEAARAMVMAKMSWDRTAEKVEEAYVQLLGASGLTPEQEATAVLR